eukprot:symbB.v1.2.004610.t1/scaffold259.1/size252385/12
MPSLLPQPSTFTLDAWQEVDETACDVLCDGWNMADFGALTPYFSSLPGFCGGNAANVFSFYEVWNSVMADSMERVLDRTRTLWWQVVLVQTFLTNSLHRDLYEEGTWVWRLHASSANTGRAAFPLHRNLPEPIVGLVMDEEPEFPMVMGTSYQGSLQLGGKTVMCLRFLFDLACWLDPSVAMPELKVITLRGDVLALDVTEIQTVQQLKARLLEQFPCEDPVEQKIRRVAAVFQGNSLLNDAQTLNEVGLDAESEVSVVYTSNEIEAASRNDVNSEGFFGVKIPQAVTEVSTDAFRGCPKLVKVVIPDSVTSIEYGAFAECESLESVTIPLSVTSIRDYAFAGCRSLKSIDIPDSVTSIRSRAFAQCQSLKNINIPDSITIIESGAFAQCESLESIDIPDSVTSIQDNTFWGCVCLENISIPDSVTSIRSRDFAQCSSLKNINIPDSITIIECGTFAECVSLESIDIPDSVTSIGYRAFEECSSLKNINIPDSITIIECGAFAECVSLDSIEIPNSVRSIWDNAFERCSSLENINIPDSVTRIGDNAFKGCSSLKNINIPDSVARIECGAFAECVSLESIDIPDSVEYIGDQAFFGCRSLKRINIPSVVEIHGGAFIGCNALESIVQ